MNNPICISFDVPGHCKPAGSKRAFPNKYTGRIVVTDDCTKSRDWKTDVTWAAKAAYSGPILTCALAVSFAFIVPRPGGDWGAKDKLRAKARGWPTTRPDLLKLARGVEDALTGVIYADDSLIVREVLTKDYHKSREAFIGVKVTITALEAMPVAEEQKELIPSDGVRLL